MLDTFSLGVSFTCNATVSSTCAQQANVFAPSLLPLLRLALRRPKMDVEAFRKNGKDMVDYICSYIQTLPQRRVIPDVQPGYLKPLLPGAAPLKGEEWKTIMKDIDDYIMPGVRYSRVVPRVK